MRRTTLKFQSGKSSDIPDLLPVDDLGDQIREDLDVQRLGNGAIKTAALQERYFFIGHAGGQGDHFAAFELRVFS